MNVRSLGTTKIRRGPCCQTVGIPPMQRIADPTRARAWQRQTSRMPLPLSLRLRSLLKIEAGTEPSLHLAGLLPLPPQAVPQHRRATPPDLRANTRPPRSGGSRHNIQRSEAGRGGEATVVVAVVAGHPRRRSRTAPTPLSLRRQQASRVGWAILQQGPSLYRIREGRHHDPKRPSQSRRTCTSRAQQEPEMVRRCLQTILHPGPTAALPPKSRLP